MQSKQSLFAAKQTIRHMTPAVGIAILAGALGFSALYISPVPMVQDFGKMLKLGVIIAFLTSVFFLIPLLFIRDHFFPQPQKKRAKTKEGAFERVLRLLTQGTLKLKEFIIVVAIALTALGMVGDLQTGVETDIERFMPQDTPALSDMHQLRQALGTTDQVVVLYEGEDLLTEDVMHWVDTHTEGLHDQFPDAIVHTKSITSILRKMNDGQLPAGDELMAKVADLPESQRKLVLTTDLEKGVIMIGIKHLDTAEMRTFIEALGTYLNHTQLPHIHIKLTGKSVLDVEMLTALTTGRHKMTLLGIGLVFLALLLVYRHPIKALVAVLPISLIIGWSGGLMYMLGFDYTPLTATLGALVIGIGTEFTILIMERFYEERRNGRVREEAIVVAIQKIGKAILASGLTVIGGFSALIISDFVILSNFGLMTVINMTLSLISTLIVLPPLLLLLDRFVKTKPSNHVSETAVI